MVSIVTAFSFIVIIILGTFHISRTRIHTTVAAIRAFLQPRNPSDAADILSRIYPHGHLAVTASSDILNPILHDGFVTYARDLIRSVNPQQRMERWRKWAGKCTEKFLPVQDVNFAGFIQCITLCTILAGLYDIDPEILSPLEIASITRALNRHSDGSSLLDAKEVSVITEYMHRWVKGERAPWALEIIFPAYESMWRLAAVTLDYVIGDPCRCNAFLDFSENLTECQFRAFKVKDTKPSVEAIMMEILRLHPPICSIMRKSKHPWWKRPFYPLREKADIASAHRSSVYGDYPETFDAMRFHRTTHNLLAFGHGRLGCIAEEWAPMATALIVAKVVDRVDDIRFILARHAPDTSVDDNIKTEWSGWVIKKKETADTLP